MEKINVGEKVYYKKDKEDKWRGPAKVIGKDGKTVVVKQDSDVRETSRSHVITVRKMADYYEKEEIEECNENDKDMMDGGGENSEGRETEEGEMEEEEEEDLRSDEEETEEVEEREEEGEVLREEGGRERR